VRDGYEDRRPNGKIDMKIAPVGKINMKINDLMERRI